MRTCLRYIAYPAAILLLFATWSAWGQTTTTGSIVGVVADPSGAVVPDAKLALKDVARGATHAAVSSKQGEFRFDLLLAGSYSVTVTASGFQTAVRKVEVSVGSVSSIDFALPLGTATTTVEVSGQAALIQTESGNIAANINETQAANVPNPGNDLTYIAQISPGSVGNTACILVKLACILR